MMHFLRRYGVRSTIGLVLLVCVYGSVSKFITYQRELAICLKIRTLGGYTGMEYRGPAWIPESLQADLKVFWSVTDVYLGNHLPPDLAPLGIIDNSRVADTEIKNLLGLSELVSVDLSGAPITDAAIEDLRQMRSLEEIDLMDTQTTPAGRDRLRKALPNCKISPSP